MKKEDIITLPHENLRKRSKRVAIVSDEDRKLIADLIESGLDWETSREHELCVGLAAVQVNIMKRLVIVRSDQDKQDNQDFVSLINPKIVKTFGELEEDFEGCLSVKDIYGKVPRYPKIKVKALDEKGEEFRMTVEGFLARLIQHEVDHTNGILFIDHIKDTDKFYEITESGKIEKLEQNKVAESSILWD